MAEEMAEEFDPQDNDHSGRIDIGNPDELDDWGARLGIAPEELIAAVRAVGARSEDVVDYLAGQSAAGPSS
jgi:hypothetical protein